MGATANKAFGKTKRTVGRVTGNRSMQARGTVQEYVGKAQSGAKKAGRRVRNAAANARRSSKRPSRSSKSRR
ncbi:MAG: CsbD family protein [Halobacteriales archaeon]|nr:CsbD family protein [Halobacteriales archaeon]